MLAVRPHLMDSDIGDRVFLLEALARFARHARKVPGVCRIAIIGSLTTDKPTPKDADVLVTVEDNVDIAALAKLGRKLKGTAQTRNRGADIFLADSSGTYIGRTCSFRECHPRSACRGHSCGLGAWICDDFDAVRLSAALIAEPPLQLWPQLIVRAELPSDTRAVLLHEGAQHVENRGAV